jgi:hypothetical protein
MEVCMRFTRMVCLSAVALASGVGAAPALADDPPLVPAAPKGEPLEYYGDWPGCPRGTRAVWVDQEARHGWLEVGDNGKLIWHEDVKAFHGWQCLPR